jgi:hypothetical protein
MTRLGLLPVFLAHIGHLGCDMSPTFVRHFCDISVIVAIRTPDSPSVLNRHRGRFNRRTYTLARVNIAAETFWIFALALLIFGSVFVFLGLSSERNYWSQRDPSGNAKKDATKFSQVYANAFKYAAGEYRAPLRIAAIGVIQWYLAIVCAIVAVLFGV